MILRGTLGFLSSACSWRVPSPFSPSVAVPPRRPCNLRFLGPRTFFRPRPLCDQGRSRRDVRCTPTSAPLRNGLTVLRSSRFTHAPKSSSNRSAHHVNETIRRSYHGPLEGLQSLITTIIRTESTSSSRQFDNNVLRKDSGFVDCRIGGDGLLH